jgi:hypothetical protein
MHVALYAVPVCREPVNGVLYAIEVPSRTKAGLTYDVRQLADGTWECSCPGFRYQARADGVCAHLDAVLPMAAGIQFLAEIM